MSQDGYEQFQYTVRIRARLVGVSSAQAGEAIREEISRTIGELFHLDPTLPGNPAVEVDSVDVEPCDGGAHPRV